MTVPLTFDPALTFLEHVDGEVFCSSLNGYLWESGFVDINFEEAITYSKNVGGSSAAWQLQDWCTPESSPPDWRPTQAISRTNYPYFKGLTICKRKSGSPRGSPWSCNPNPNPTPAANGAIDPTLQVCTNWDAGTQMTIGDCLRALEVPMYQIFYDSDEPPGMTKPFASSCYGRSGRGSGRGEK
jgi:hypothetical protein